LLPLDEEALSRFATGDQTAGLPADLAGKVLQALLTRQHQQGAAAAPQEIRRLLTQMAAEGMMSLDDSLLRATQPGGESSLFPLRLGLWVDLGRGEILQRETSIPLTGREIRVLGRLLRQPKRYISATALAEGIVSEESLDPGHCIEETIRKLRRKLGDDAARPDLLRCRREVGYGIFPETVPYQQMAPPPGNPAA